MGILWPNSSTRTNTVKVWYLNQDGALEVPLSYSLKQLKFQLDQINTIKKHIYFHWSLLTQKQDEKKLEEIIQDQIAAYPHNKDKNKVFIVIEDDLTPQNLQQVRTKHGQLYSKLRGVQNVPCEQEPNFSLGNSGNVVFEGRESALLASSIQYAVRSTNISQQKLESLSANFLKHHNLDRGFSSMGNLFQNLGLVSDNSKINDAEMLQMIKQKIMNSTQFSDFDPKFIFYLEQIYIKFMIKSLGKIHYINYQSIQDFNIQNIPSDSKIGIIGDFGTGLKDSIQLLSNMILRHDVNVILHLGDVYYAGTPQQYQVSITKPLNDLRIEAKRQIRFYSIPGNHDYYSWGLPFLCFVKSINSSQFQKQKASYFCLRDQQSKWQFLGMDTAFYDSNPINQLDPSGVGPHVRSQELSWHKYRLKNWKGSTILMTHHQLFSIHERINGSITKYRKFSCLNPMLYAQMFQYIPRISAWFWGHQHSVMLFKQNVFGLSKGRLLGNSSFHVMFQKQNPYERKPGYPYIPLIEPDQEYSKKYLPVNPNAPTQSYFGLTYALIDMSKMDQQNNLPIEYWCSPCYSNEQFDKMDKLPEEQKDKFYFKEYKLHEETIYSVDRLKKQLTQIKNTDKIYLRCEIGLSLAVSQKNKQSRPPQNQPQQIIQQVSQDEVKIGFQAKNKQDQLTLNLQGSEFQIQIFQQALQSLYFGLKTFVQDKQEYLYLSVNDKNQVQLIRIQSTDDLISKNGVWICSSINPSNDDLSQKDQICCNIPLRIENKFTKKYLSWQIKYFGSYPCLQDKCFIQQEQLVKSQKPKKQNTQCLWMFYSQNPVKQ